MLKTRGGRLVAAAATDGAGRGDSLGPARPGGLDVTTRSDHESLSAAVAELGRRYASGEVSRERLDARLLELRICPGLRRSRSRALPSIPPPVIIFSIEEAVGANAGTHGRTPALAAGGLR